MGRYDDVKRIFESHGGIARTEDMLRERVHTSYIANLLSAGHISRIKRGVYEWLDDGPKDDLEIIGRLIPESILCMESALHYYGYTDRTPGVWHIAVSKNINKKKVRLAYPPIKVHFVAPHLLGVGVCEGIVNEVGVRVYDRERAVCDAIRHAGKMDPEVVNQAIRSYVADPAKNIGRFMEYSGLFRIQRKAESLVGVWL
jgi:predicted transcriptional regulator of viral defense system